jgi:hypothetical protein
MKDLCVTGGLSRAQVNYSYSLRLFGDLHHATRPILRLARGDLRLRDLYVGRTGPRRSPKSGVQALQPRPVLS